MAKQKIDLSKINEKKSKIESDEFETFEIIFSIPGVQSLIDIGNSMDSDDIGGESIVSFVSKHLKSWTLDIPPSVETIDCLPIDVFKSIFVEIFNTGSKRKN